MSIDADTFKRTAHKLLTAEPPQLAELFKYIGENYERFTSEAKMLADRGWEAIKPDIKEALAAAADSPDARALKRLFARIEGKHWDAHGLVGGLGAAPSRKHPIVEAAGPLFEKHLQIYLDLLWDAAQHTHSGAPLIQMQLFALTADELLSGFHLAQRGYASQALSHARTVLEALDLIELFKRNPDAVYEWAGLDPKAAWTEFSPAAARKKLGEKPKDPIYSFLSEYGPHVTWRMIKNRTAIEKGKDSEDKGAMALWVGGTPFVHAIVFSIESCLQVLVAAVIKVAGVFGQFLNKKEAIALVRQVSQEFSQFILQHFVGWAKEVGLDPTDLERFIREEIPSRLDAATKELGAAQG